MRRRLLAGLVVLLGGLNLAVPSARAASFGTGEDRRTQHDITFGLPGSSCSGAPTYAATIREFLPTVETATGTVTYKLEGVPAGLTCTANFQLSVEDPPLPSPWPG